MSYLQESKQHGRGIANAPPPSIVWEVPGSVGKLLAYTSLLTPLATSRGTLA